MHLLMMLVCLQLFAAVSFAFVASLAKTAAVLIVFASCSSALRQSASFGRVAPITHHNHKQPLRLFSSKDGGVTQPLAEIFTFVELEDYAKASGLRLKSVATGPVLRIEAFPVDNDDEPIGYLTAFLRPFPFGLFHLDTIQVKNRRQYLGYQRKGWTIEGPGISFIMGSYALRWAWDRGCRKTELLAVKDTEQMHAVLVRLYESFGFKTVREVGDEQSSIQDRLTWGAVGTLMEMDLKSFFSEWTPKLRSMTKIAKMAAAREKESLVANESPKQRQQQQQQPSIALTREDGANDKLAALLKGFNCVEIPCIAFGPGSDVGLLPAALTSTDVIVITSPQAAQVFLTAWSQAGKPQVRIATVGKGTSKPLTTAGLEPVFEPSDATAETLAKELPTTWGTRVLYPSSSIAENTLAKGLEARGFVVTRLNTYETVPAEWSPAQLQVAKSIDIVTFASPSTIRVWSERVGVAATAVVIGPTSAKACKSAGFERIECPEGSKGIEAWADLVKSVVAAKSVGSTNA